MTQEDLDEFGMFKTVQTPEVKDAGVDEFLAQFNRWLEAHDREVAAKALEEAADELDAYRSAHDVAECAALVPGETGRQEAIDRWLSICEEPEAWLRTRARRYACDTGTVERPCRGCPDCQAGPAVSFGEGR